MGRRVKLIILLSLIFALAACSTLFSPQRAFEDLKEAQTPAQEADILIHINHCAADIGLAAFDEEGNTLEPHDSGFPDQIHAVDLHVNGQTTYHIMIHPENIYILLRE